MANITTVQGRNKCAVRREPHWARLAKGCYLGYRKMVAGGEGSWVSRFRSEDTGAQKYKALGDFGETPAHERFDAARLEAEGWFAHLGKGGSCEPTTVGGACERYVRHLLETSGPSAAKDAEGRFNRRVYSDPKFNALELQKLSVAAVKVWRSKVKSTPVVKGLGESAQSRARSDSALNRDMTSLRAAFNLALADGKTTSGLAWEQALKPIKNADKRKDIYLDRAHRIELLHAAAATDAPLSHLLTSLCLVPIRPGAIAKLVVEDFHRQLKTLNIGKDKAGQDRIIALPDDTAAFFAKQCKDKLPTAPLLTNAFGGHWNKDQWKKPVRKAVRKAKLPGKVTAYTLRHSVITDLVQSGLDTLTIAQLSGTSVAMIEKNYGHLTKAHARKALATLAL